MKFHLTTAQGRQLITGYDASWVEINTQRFSKSLIILPERLISDWQVTDFDSLTYEHFLQIAALAPEVVLLGTGAKIRFPHPKLYAALTNANIGLECMDTAAACRTYNILMAEGRSVAAALII
ncbi:MAG: Xcc1710-like domain-containing protein [Methylophilaceae bacterium]|nr:Xcc1710-like domain-containing protein [Methylophilaceae bacterium]